MSQQDKIKKLAEREYVSIRSCLGNDWAMFFIMLGAREAGKSYAVMEMFLRQWKKYGRPFYWIRLSEVSTSKMLKDNANAMVDPDLYRKYGLKLTTKGNVVYDNGKKMATVLALSNMAKDKGVALFDKDFLNDPNMYYNICIDEFQREKNERNYFDIMYNLVNELENIVRSTKKRIRVIMVANLLEECSDVLTSFQFIPEQYGIYKIRSKRAVVWYMPPTEAYLNRRKGTVADMLMPTASTFTNKVEQNRKQIYKGKIIKPICIIKFTKDKNDWFTVWDSRVIKKYNNETCKNILPMRPYLDELFVVQRRNDVVAMFDANYYYYRDLVTQKMFQKQLEILLPRGN